MKPNPSIQMQSFPTSSPWQASGNKWNIISKRKAHKKKKINVIINPPRTCRNYGRFLQIISNHLFPRKTLNPKYVFVNAQSWPIKKLHEPQLHDAIQRRNKKRTLERRKQQGDEWEIKKKLNGGDLDIRKRRSEEEGFHDMQEKFLIFFSGRRGAAGEEGQISRE